MTQVIGRRFRQLLLKRIIEERNAHAGPVVSRDVIIRELIIYPQGADKWGNIGTVTVSYSMRHPNYRATYGFDSLANVSCYMD